MVTLRGQDHNFVNLDAPLGQFMVPLIAVLALHLTPSVYAITLIGGGAFQVVSILLGGLTSCRL